MLILIAYRILLAGIALLRMRKKPDECSSRETKNAMYDQTALSAVHIHSINMCYTIAYHMT